MELYLWKGNLLSIIHLETLYIFHFNFHFLVVISQPCLAGISCLTDL